MSEEVATLLRQAWLSAEDNKDNATAYGSFLRKEGCLDDAHTVYLKTLYHHPDDHDLNLALARVLYEKGDQEASCDIFNRLIITYPDDIDILITAGKIYKNTSLYAEAENCYRRALALPTPEKKPLAAFNYAHLLLMQQRWQAGFAAYEARLALPAAFPSPFGLPSLSAITPMGKSVLIWSDQGLGDAIMFARFIPRLQAKGYQLSLLVQEPLKRMFKNLSDPLAIYGPLDEMPKFDAALAIASLPFLLSAEPFWDGPYLSPSASSPVVVAGQRRVGLVWSGSQSHVNSANRNLPFSTLAPLFDIEGIEYVSLQKDIGSLKLPDNVRDVSPYLTDLEATAGIIQQLDLVVTVDTSVAHLAGAMGKKTWLMLPARDCDWRWGLSNHTNIWYPSMTHFRQPKIGDWAPVIAAIAERLKNDDF